MNNKYNLIAIVMMGVGTLSWIMEMMSGGHSDVLWFIGVVCYIAGAIILYSGGKKFRKSQKKDEEETKKW